MEESVGLTVALWNRPIPAGSYSLLIGPRFCGFAVRYRDNFRIGPACLCFRFSRALLSALAALFFVAVESAKPHLDPCHP